MDKFEQFYNDVFFWSLNDFCTPNIKAEVIFDMLLSPYITDIVQGGLGETTPSLVLLAKEFPLKIRENNKGIKVDYLLWDKNKRLYIVELKTDNTSFSDNQCDCYVKLKNKEYAIGEALQNIIRDNTGGNTYKNFRNKGDVKGSHKYGKTLYQMKIIMEDIIKFEKEPSPDQSKEIFKNWANNVTAAIADALNEMAINLVYVSIEDIKDPNDLLVNNGIPNIVLSRLELFAKDKEKREKWELVKAIIEKTYDPETFSKLWTHEIK